MSHNDLPEFDYAAHSMSTGKKMFLILIALVYALGFGLLWYALFTGGMSGALLLLIGAGITIAALVFGVFLPLMRRPK